MHLGPPLLFVVDATAVPATVKARIGALLTQGQRLNIHGIVLGAWTDGTTRHVDHDGSTVPVHDHPTRPGTRADQTAALPVLTAAETARLLADYTRTRTTPQRPVPPAPEQHPVHDDERAAHAGSGQQHDGATAPRADARLAPAEKRDRQRPSPTAGADPSATSPGWTPPHRQRSSAWPRTCAAA
jgi:hypothetical protein